MLGSTFMTSVALATACGAWSGQFKGSELGQTESARAEADAVTVPPQDAGEAVIGEERGGGGDPVNMIAAASRGSCNLPININGRVENGDVTSEPRRAGITDVVMIFDGSIGPGPHTVTLFEQGGCPPGTPEAYQFYSGGSFMSAYVNNETELQVSFFPALENGRTYNLRTNLRASGTTRWVEIRGLVGDVNSDGRVNGADRSAVVSVWTSVANYSCESDLNGDDRTNGADRSIVVSAWTGGNNCAP